MKSKLILLGTVFGLTIISASQSSAHHQGWYIGLEAGANWIGDTDFSFDSAYDYDLKSLSSPYGQYGTLDFNTGWAALATIGYGFERNWRVELEAGYRSNETDSFFSGKIPSMSLEAIACESDWCGGPYVNKGDLDEWSFMANVIYDIPLTDRLDLNIGVGAGMDRAHFKDNNGVNDSDWNFAYQGIVGLSYKINSRLDLTLNYRYLNVDSPNFSEARGRYGADEYHFQDLEKHTVTVGLRYDLYEDEAPIVQAPPPPVVPPATPEPEQFVIFFGFNKCNITAEADAVLAEAASSAKTNGSASVAIVGHTDTVGSDAYNQKLSDCRANAARTNLVAKGVSANSITASGRGETELLVKTNDNVKEPQNRRATIDINN
ncbi:MAG: OmpA family protein [Micropepsaceae bacterium]